MISLQLHIKEHKMTRATYWVLSTNLTQEKILWMPSLLSHFVASLPTLKPIYIVCLSSFLLSCGLPHQNAAMHEKSLFTGLFPWSRESLTAFSFISHTNKSYTPSACQSRECSVWKEQKKRLNGKWRLKKKDEGEEEKEGGVELACVILLCLFISV